MTSPEQESSEPLETALAKSPAPQAAGDPPQESAPAELETPAGQAPEADSSSKQDSAPVEPPGARPESPPSERLPQPGRRAQPVTVTMLKAAARSPEDVKEIVRVESRLREKKRIEPASGEEPREASAETSGPEEAEKAEKAGRGSEPKSAAAQPSLPPGAATAPAAKRSAPASATATRAPRQARPPEPSPGNPQARAPQPRALRRPESTPAPPAKAPPAGPAPAPRPSAWPVAAAILVTGAALTWAIRSTLPAPQPGSAAPALAAASPAPSAQPLPAPAPEPSRRGTLASFGRDHVVYSDGSGELVVLKGDAVSGELSLERVYVVRRDRQRDLGDAARPLHGVYLDDLHLERSAELRAATLAFRTRLSEARRKGEGLEVLDAAAARLARAGGADLLIPLLEPTNPTLDRRAATIGLLESRYRCALPHVAELIRRYKDGPQGRRLCDLSGSLIGQDLDPSAPEAAAEAIEAWCREHPLLDRFEQVPPAGADLRR